MNTMIKMLLPFVTKCYQYDDQNAATFCNKMLSIRWSKTDLDLWCKVNWVCFCQKYQQELTICVKQDKHIYLTQCYNIGCDFHEIFLINFILIYMGVHKISVLFIWGGGVPQDFISIFKWGPQDRHWNRKWSQFQKVWKPLAETTLFIKRITGVLKI